MKKLFTALSLTLCLPLPVLASFSANAKTTNINALTKTFVSQTQDLRPQVVKTALTAYNNAIKDGIKDNKQIITVIDYSMPSSEKRLWVLDLKHQKVLYHTLVAHGRNSGNNYATQFSNQPNSLETSLGLYLTKNTYDGHDGYSLVLDGLDKGFNNNAESRHVIMHGAKYVSQGEIKAQGRIGRSWGCPALNEKMAKPVINTVKNGTLVLAYYPNKDWLNHSVYLA